MKTENEAEERSEGQDIFIVPTPELPSHGHGPSVPTLEPTSLPTYEELKPQSDEMSPPSYWSLFPNRIYYDNSVITKTIV